MSINEIKVTIFKHILNKNKHFQIHLFESIKGPSVKRLEAITAQRKKKLPKSWWYKLRFSYLKDTGSLRMTSNLFRSHCITASKVIHEFCVSILFLDQFNQCHFKFWKLLLSQNPHIFAESCMLPSKHLSLN